MRLGFYTLAVVLLGASDSVSAQDVRATYIAPSPANVSATIEAGRGREPSYQIFVSNRSTVPVIVSGVTLTECENVKEYCSKSGIRIRVPVGGRTMVKRVNPKNPSAPFTFRYSYTWHADSAAAEFKRVLEEGGLTTRPGVGIMSQEDAQRTKVLDRESITRLGSSIARASLQVDSVTLRVGEFLLARQLEVTVYDSSGTTLGRIPAFNWRHRLGILVSRRDTIIAAMPGRTEVTIFLAPPAPQLQALLIVNVVPDSAAKIP